MFHCVEKHIGLAYFGLTVGAGFASGQEVLQYYVSYGTWGLAAGLIVLLLMPITAMVILQYGSYFRATSHGKVFDKVTSAVTARFLDYTITGPQFCLGFVMMAGAGRNLNQQFGLSLWVGSVIMALLVLAAGMLDVEKITNLVGAIFAVVLLVLAVALLFRVEDVAHADLPMLLLVEQVHPALGPVAAIATYLMTFSTCLSVMYSMGRRVTVGNPAWYRMHYAVLVGDCVSPQLLPLH